MTVIRNCKFECRCTQRWADFEPVPSTMRVRFCTRCQSAVHRADTQGEFDELAAQGKCVAVFDPPTRRFTLGRPDSGRGVD